MLFGLIALDATEVWVNRGTISLSPKTEQLSSGLPSCLMF